MDLTIVISLMLLAIVLLLIEIFLVPGISVAGVLGIAGIIASVIWAFQIDTTTGLITLSAGILVCAFFAWLVFRSRVLDKMSLKAEIDSTVETVKNLNINAGDEGIAISRLATIGKVQVNGNTVEAKTNGSFIDEGTEVIVVEVFESNILVKAKK
ncbi:MAG: NfeD family protein [Prevotellaceae bacterium]|jgi:membrane-bound ClpP family serine protease|nr:NfeD family protein [Prevotellaceae bacterium]